MPASADDTVVVSDTTTAAAGGPPGPLPSQAASRVPAQPAGDFSDMPGSASVASRATPKASGFQPAASVRDDMLTSPVADVFDNPDGSRTAALTPYPVRFRDPESNSWRQMNLTLDTSDPATLRGAVAPSDAPAFNRSAKGAVVRFGRASAAFAVRHADALDVAGTATGRQVRFAGALPGGRDLIEELTPVGFKESVVLPDRSSPTSYDLLVDLPSGFSARQGGPGVEFVDAAGTVQASVAVGAAFDSRPVLGNRVDAPVTLVGVAGGVATVRVSIDPSFLADPRVVLPVTIDPLFYTYSANSYGGSDTSIIETLNNQPSSYWSDPYLYAGKVCYFYCAQARALLRFDLSSIGVASNISVSDAYLHLVNTDTYWWNGSGLQSTCAQQQLYLYGLGSGFDSYTVDANKPYRDGYGPTWSPPFAWSQNNGSCPAGSNSVVDISATALAQRWLTGVEYNYGIWLENTNEASYYGQKFYSGDTIGAPTLYVTYQYVNRLPSAVTPVSPAHRDIVATAAPTLQTTTSFDPDGDPVQYWFRVATGSDGQSGSITNSGWISSPSWTPPAGSLRDGGTYYWKVWVRDPSGVGNPANWVVSNGVSQFRVDLRIGSQSPSPYDELGPVKVNLATGNLVTGTSGPAAATVSGGIGVSLAYNSKQPPRHGLTGSYYDDTSVYGPDCNHVIDNVGTLPSVTRLDPAVSFDWGTTSPWPSMGGNGDCFIVNWNGFVTVPVSGSYQFGASADDGFRISVAGQSRTGDTFWHDQSAGAPQYGSAVSLTAGQSVPIKVEYYENTQSASIQLWSIRDGNAATAVPVPTGWLTPAPAGLPDGWTMTSSAPAVQWSRLEFGDTWISAIDADGEGHVFTKEVSALSSNSTGWIAPTGEAMTLSQVFPYASWYLREADVTSIFAWNGTLLAVETSDDDPNKPAAPVFLAGAGGQLTRMTDPVRRDQGAPADVNLRYAGFDSCGTPPAGFFVAPAGNLCAVEYWDGTRSDLYYDSSGRLARIVDPGGETTDFGYDTNSLVNRLRDPLQYDAVAAGRAANDDTSRTLVGYDTCQRVASVQLATGTTGGQPLHSYNYGTGACVLGSATTMNVAGLAPATGWARRVTFNSRAQVTADTDATNLTTTYTWDNLDLLHSTTDPAGRKTTTVYDGTINTVPAPLAVDTYGPAPAAQFTASDVPQAAYLSTVPHTRTTYDGDPARPDGLQRGLAAQWWNNDNLGAQNNEAVAYRSTAGDANGALNLAWADGQIPTGLSRSTQWSARFTGEIKLDENKVWTFSLCRDDGARLWIDDLLVIDSWTYGGSSTNCPNGGTETGAGFFDNTCPAFPTHPCGAGSRHRIRIDFTQASGPAAIGLRWNANNIGAVAAGDHLFPAYRLVTDVQVDDAQAGVQRARTGYLDPASGLPTSTTEDPGGLGLTTTTGYETLAAGHYRRRTSRTLPAGNTWAYQYYGADGLSATGFPNTCAASTTVNQGGALARTTGPDPDGAGPQSARTDEYVYDIAGRVVASRVNSDAWTCTTYDTRGRVVTRTYPANATAPARTVTNNYAVGGNPLVTSTGDAAGTITTTRDLLGRVASYTDALGNTTSYTYDQAGRLTTTAGPAGTQATGYDDAGRPLTQTLNASTVATASYTNGELTGVTYPTGTGAAGNGTSGTLGRDAAGRLSTLTWQKAATSIASDVVTYSQSGRVIDETIDGTDPYPSGTNFSYDAAGRLATARVTGHTLSYGFASSGGCGAAAAAGKNTNRTSLTDAATSYSYCYDNADRLTGTTDPNAGGLSYDTHGNTVTLGTQTFGYDIADRHLSTVSTTSSQAGPAISAVSANATSTTATVTWTTNVAATSHVAYGLTAGYTTTTGDPTLVTQHVVSLAGLACATTYHYRVTSADTNGNTTNGVDLTFTTASCAPDTTAPVISSLTATPTSQTAATITWTTDEAASSAVDYGTTTSYGNTATAVGTVRWHSVPITGLACGTLYHYRARSADAANNQVTSPDGTFTTPACPSPLAITLVDTANGGGTGTSVSLALVGVQAGDLILVTTTSGANDTVTVPAGYTLGATDTTGAGAGDIRRTWFWRIAPSATSSVAVTYSTNGSLKAAAAVVYRNVDNVTPIDAVSTTASTSSGTSVTAAGVTTTAAGDRLVALEAAGAASKQVSFSPVPAGMSQQVDQANSSGQNSRAAGIADQTISTAGATGTRTVSYSKTAALSAQLVALDSAMGPGGSGSQPPTGDVAAPTVSGTSSSPGLTWATVMWATNEAATTFVDYGTTTSYGFTTGNATLTTSHSATLTGLACATTYHYRIRSADTWGNQNTTVDATMTTSACANGGPTTISYERDALDRIITRKLAGTVVARYSYSGDGDTADATLNGAGAVTERIVALVGGTLMTDRSSGDTWSYTNIHGDTVATADGTGTRQGGTVAYDPYGQQLGATPDNLAGNSDYAWLGGKQRMTEHEADISMVEMGVRQYSPRLGRFLETDPVEGGSANDYDYVSGDPINAFDIDGTCQTQRTHGLSWRRVRNARCRVSRHLGVSAQGCFYVYCVSASTQGGDFYFAVAGGWGKGALTGKRGGIGGGVTVNYYSHPARQWSKDAVCAGGGRIAAVSGCVDFHNRRNWSIGVGPGAGLWGFYQHSENARSIGR